LIINNKINFQDDEDEDEDDEDEDEDDGEEEEEEEPGIKESMFLIENLITN